MNPQTNQLDPQIINLAKAIRQVESGGKDVAGASGEKGMYQFTEPTWNAYSSKYGINVPLKDATNEQQNEVVYKKIKEWKESGYNPGQIASMWNAGEGRPDAHLQNWRGVNKFGVSYDTPAYAKKVADAYQQFKGESAGQMAGTQSSDPYASLNKYDTNPDMSAFTQTQGTPKEPGVVGNIAQGNYTGAIGKGASNITGLMNKIASPFAGLAAIPTQLIAKGLDKYAGTNIGDPFKGGIGKNIDGGKGINVSELNVNKKIGDTVKAGAYTATAAGTGLIARAVAANSAKALLNNPSIVQRLPNRVTPELFLKADKTKQMNILGDMLKKASRTGADGDAQNILKAMNKLGGSGVFKKVIGGLVGKKFGATDLLGVKEAYDLIKGFLK